MTAAAKTAGQGGARPPGLAANLTVAIVCLAGAAGYVALALALPAGHSQGDAGPAALPLQVGIFGLIVSGLYLVLTLRGRIPAARPNRAMPRAPRPSPASSAQPCCRCHGSALRPRLGLRAALSPFCFPARIDRPAPWQRRSACG